MGGVNSPSTRIGKNGDQNMFFNVKRPRVHRELKGRAFEEEPRRQRPRQEMAEWDHRDLRRDRRDDQRLRSVPEELVHEREEDAGGQTKDPHPERQNGHCGVVRLRHRQIDLLHHALLLIIIQIMINGGDDLLILLRGIHRRRH